jgi:hypothetical protein
MRNIQIKKILIAAALAIGSTISALSINSEQAGAINLVTTIDFDENVGVGSNPRTGGPKLDNLWANYGLTMDSSTKELWLYNSSCKPNNGESTDNFSTICTGDDPDLATGKGRYKKGGKWYEYDSPVQNNVLIIQENNQNSPDDNTRGGKITFNFTDEDGVFFKNIGMLDFDESSDPKFKFTFLDNTFQEFTFGKDADENDSRVTLLSQTWDGKPLKKDNSLRDYQFNLDNVKKLEVTLPGSGAVTYLNYERNSERRRVPESTPVLGLVIGAFGIGSFFKRK